MYVKIYASLQIDSMEGWVWTNCKVVRGNNLVIITNLKNKKRIKCYKRTIDDNFEKSYNRKGEGRLKLDLNEDVIVMNEFYRTKLKVNTKCHQDLDIRSAKWSERIVTNWNHPNPQVQYSNQMGVWAMLIAILSLLLALFSLYR